MAKLFGFSIEETQNKSDGIISPVPKNNEDGVDNYIASGFYGQYVDIEGAYRSEHELIKRYREMALHPEADGAIEDVVNEAIVSDLYDSPVEVELSNLNASESIKKKIREEFRYIKELMDFDKKSHEIFRNWYIDGRLYYLKVIDQNNPQEGLKDLRYIDPRKIRKVKEPIKEKDKRTGVTVYKGSNEYYMYNPKGITTANQAQGVKIAKDSIAYCHSGILDNRGGMVYSHLHKAIKPLNQLRMLEDAVVIYRLARAPERRIFYIDVGNLPKMKAEQYLRDMMVKHKNKLTYDATTGEVRDDRKFMTMLEDFWLPRREGGRGTEITTLPGGQNLGEMEDVDYFRRKLYKSLNVPTARMEQENQFQLGRASEITRDELKFNKFIKRLRNRFAMLFDELLEIHLALKGVTTRKEWQQMKQDIYYDFMEDNHFTELKDTEIMTERLRLLSEIDSYVGKYFSEQWVRTNVLRLTEDEVETIQTQIDQEAEGDEGDFPEESVEETFLPREPEPEIIEELIPKK